MTSPAEFKKLLDSYVKACVELNAATLTPNMTGDALSRVDKREREVLALFQAQADTIESMLAAVRAGEELAREAVSLSIDPHTRRPVGYCCAMCPTRLVGKRKMLVHDVDCKVLAFQRVLQDLNEEGAK